MKKSMVAAALLACVSAFGAGDAEKGKDVFEQNCGVCHNADSTERKMGPGLKGLFKKAELPNKKKVTDANVLDFINKGSSEKGMPGFADQLTDQEKTDLIAYLKTL
ncbi:MAG: cytochrome c [Bryobacterales bacterium]|nr:cytochrome c [Bryobacterales bacterium]MBV9398874.1 cytochrome c [Bryobacterales bacterium]